MDEQENMKGLKLHLWYHKSNIDKKRTLSIRSQKVVGKSRSNETGFSWAGNSNILIRHLAAILTRKLRQFGQYLNWDSQILRPLVSAF